MAKVTEAVEGTKEKLAKSEGALHAGDTVKKDGAYELQAGMHVTPKKSVADRAKMKLDADSPKESAKESTSGAKSARAKHKHVHIENHYDAEGNPKGHTVRFTPANGGNEVSAAVSDLDGVHDHLEEHLGE